MLVLDDTETRHGAEEQSPRSVVNNGNFGLVTDACMGTEFSAGDEFDGWIMSAPSRRRTSVMRLCSTDSESRSLAQHALPSPGRTSHHPLAGHIAVLSGKMSQTLVTVPGESYRLRYDSLDVQCEPEVFAHGTVGDVLIDGKVVQTFVTLPASGFVSHEAYFMARTRETLLSFTAVGRVPFGLSNVTAAQVEKVVLCERDMIVGLLGETLDE